MKFSDLEHARAILVYGFAREGKSSYMFLKKKFPKAKIAIFDDGIGKYKGPVPFDRFDAIVLSAGIPREKLRGVSPKKITSNIEIFFDNLDEAQRKRVIGVTGTKGKSTTTKFCAELLNHSGFRAVASGNIGSPLLDTFGDFTKGKLDYVVAELSSYQLEYLRTSPGIALFLNLFPEHLNRHKTLARYLRAKSNLWAFQKKGDILIVPKSWKELPARHGIPQPKGKLLLSVPAAKTLFPKDSIFQSRHFLENFGVVKALSRVLNLPEHAFKKTAARFRGLPYRLEYFATRRGLDFYDDSLSTNPDSTLEGVKFFGKRLGSVILGGQDRKQKFALLIMQLKKQGTMVIALDSETQGRILHTLKRLKHPNYHAAQNLRKAVRCMLLDTPKGKVCLLSTAAPSFDRFKNYADRGTQFKKYVRELKV